MEFLKFMFTRKTEIKEFEELDLISVKDPKNSYVPLSEDVTFLYISRLDFLLYFFFGLLTTDPKEAIKEIKSVTNESFEFEEELIYKNPYKWNYREFWVVVEGIRSNPVDTYWKIPAWINIYSAVYLQIFVFKQSGEKKEYHLLGEWIFKEVSRLSKKNSNEDEIIRSFEIEEDQYEFDGSDFITTIKGYGQRF